MVVEKKRLAVLASGYGSNLQAILDACQAAAYPAEVVVVASDRKEAYALQRARAAGLPVIYHPWGPYNKARKSKLVYDLDLAARVKSFSPDLIVLAGWMRMLTMGFLAHFPMQVINLHPALPGTFPGTHAIQRAYAAFQQGEIQHTGVMVHYVPDEGMDDGPVILSELVPIYPEDTQEILEKRMHAVEHRLFVSAIAQLCSQ